jgi:hypothetical protein
VFRKIRKHIYIFTAVLTSVCGLSLTSRAAIIPSVDSMFPTVLVTWLCVDSNISQTWFCQTDNNSLTYGFESTLNSSQRTFVTSVIYNHFDPTDLNVSYQSTISYTGSSETDIVYQTGSIPSGYIGATWCDDSSPGNNKCDQHYVRMTGSAVSPTSPDSGIPCHETGHAVGLTHGYNSYPQVANDNPNLECMMTAPGTNGNLGAHNIFQINSTY